MVFQMVRRAPIVPTRTRSPEGPLPRSADIFAAGTTAAAVLVLALAVPVTVWRLGLPFPGVGYGVAEPGAPVLVSEVVPGGTAEALGVRPGDELVAIGDVAIPAAHDIRLLWGGYFDVVNRYRAGDTVTWTVRRDDGLQTLTGPMAADPMGILVSQLLVFGVFWALAFFLLWVRREVRAVRVLAWAVLAVTTGQFLRYATTLPLDTGLGIVVAQVSILARFLGPALLVHFGLVFPVESVGRRARRIILALAYGIPFLLLLGEEAMHVRGMLDPVVPYPYPLELLERFRYRDIRFWVFLGSFVACGGLLFRTYVKVRDPGVRDRIKWVVWGVGLAAGIDALAMGVVYMITGGYSPARYEAFRNVLYLLPAVGIAIAVFRHDLFDVDRVIRHTVVNVGSMAVLFVLFATVESVVSELLEDAIPSAGLVASISAGVLAAGLFTPLRRWIDRRLQQDAVGDTA